MNVAVSKVVPGLQTTVSGVQAGITTDSLVMAACTSSAGQCGQIDLREDP